VWVVVLQTCVKRIRLDMPVTDSDFVAQTVDDVDETEAAMEVITLVLLH